MALAILLAKLSLLPRVFQPTYDALFSALPFWQRWRLLLLQPINILVALLVSPYWLFNNRYNVFYIPTRSGSKRCLVYHPPAFRPQHSDGRESKPLLKPLHVHIHGGGFIGGLAEQDARWCDYLSNKTGAVVICLTYRIAPRYTFPAAHNDVDDLVSWILDHSMCTFGADPNLLTIGGASVGGNLALSTSIALNESRKGTGQGVEAKGVLNFYAPVDFRLKPEEKPIPPNYPTSDPMTFLLPLLDTYAGPSRTENLENAKLNPIVADIATLPRDILLIVAGIDILLYEQLAFVKRVREETVGEEERPEKLRIEALVVEKGFHGWLECESLYIVIRNAY